VLHRIVGVDDQVVREEVLAPELYHECVRTQRCSGPGSGRGDQPRAAARPGEFNGARQVAVLVGGGFVELRDVEHDGQRREVGRAEEVVRHSELRATSNAHGQRRSGTSSVTPAGQARRPRGRLRRCGSAHLTTVNMRVSTRASVGRSSSGTSGSTTVETDGGREVRPSVSSRRSCCR
jgi:hypothetical protein